MTPTPPTLQEIEEALDWSCAADECRCEKMRAVLAAALRSAQSTIKALAGEIEEFKIRAVRAEKQQHIDSSSLAAKTAELEAVKKEMKATNEMLIPGKPDSGCAHSNYWR